MRRRVAFTLIELLVAIGIIVVLISIALPVVSKVRRSAQVATVQAQIQSLDAAIQRYQQDFTAYPGPLPRNRLGPTIASGLVLKGGTTAIENVTGGENLVLGLLGGVAPVTPPTTPPTFHFDKDLIGRGPRGLNSANPKAHNAYIDGLPLSQGKYSDGAGTAVDSDIPEILDRFPDPMPLLYVRAQAGAAGVVTLFGKDNNADVLADDGVTVIANTQYDIREIAGYINTTSGSIGEGKSINEKAYVNFVNPNAAPPGPAVLPHGLGTVNSSGKSIDKSNGNYQYPYDAFGYFNNRAIPPKDPAAGKANSTGTPRNRDKYFLISAGPDRVYGTADDITNAGNVLE